MDESNFKFIDDQFSKLHETLNLAKFAWRRYSISKKEEDLQTFDNHILKLNEEAWSIHSATERGR